MKTSQISFDRSWFSHTLFSTHILCTFQTFCHFFRDNSQTVYNFWLKIVWNYVFSLLNKREGNIFWILEKLQMYPNVVFRIIVDYELWISFKFREHSTKSIWTFVHSSGWSRVCAAFVFIAHLRKREKARVSELSNVVLVFGSVLVISCWFCCFFFFLWTVSESRGLQSQR